MPQELLKKFPKLGHGPRMAPSILEPSRLRELLEGIVDVPMGMLGVGPDSKMNRIGALASSTFPFGKFASKLRGSDFPTQSRMGMGMTPSSGIYDDAGRYLGSGNKVDPVFQAHVGSSVGKRDPRMVTKIESVEDSFVNKGNHKGLTPSDDQYEKLMKKHGGSSKK